MKNDNMTSQKPHATMAFAMCCFIGLLWHHLHHPLVVVAVGLAPIALYLSLRFTFTIVFLFVIFSFFRIHEVFPQLYSLKIPLLLSAAAIGSIFWHISITQSIKPYWHPVFTIAITFFILVSFGVITSSNRSIAMTYFNGVYWKIIVMMFAIAWIMRSERHFAQAAHLIVAFGSIVGIVAISNKFSGIDLVEETRVTIGRSIGSVLGDPNDLALVLMFPIAFAVGLATTPGIRRYTRILGIIAAPILFFSVIATQSRGGLLGVLAVLGIFGLRKIKSKIFLGIIGAALAMALFISADISERKSGGAAEHGIDASAQGRLYAWEAAIGMAMDNPITGVGIDNFYSNYYFYSKHWDGVNHAVHSTWFGVLAETGFAGFIVFIILIGKLLRTAALTVLAVEEKAEMFCGRYRGLMLANAQAIHSGLIGTIVSGTFLTHGFTWPIYIFAALVVAMSKLMHFESPTPTSQLA